jgi:hypothetical protein
MAHKSLVLKLKARSDIAGDLKPKSNKKSTSVDNLLNIINADEKDQTSHPQFENAEMKMVDYSDNQITNASQESNNVTFSYKKRRSTFYLEDQLNPKSEDDTNSSHKNSSNNRFNKPAFDDLNKVDKVYTIGCFDLFHFGDLFFKICKL